MFDHPTTFPRMRRDATVPVGISQTRDRAWFRAEYYAWNARKGSPLDRFDPATGKPYSILNDDARRIGRLAYIAAAREAYRIARNYPLPLP
jgi:hypothetical protein